MLLMKRGDAVQQQSICIIHSLSSQHLQFPQYSLFFFYCSLYLNIGRWGSLSTQVSSQRGLRRKSFHLVNKGAVILFSTLIEKWNGNANRHKQQKKNNSSAFASAGPICAAPHGKEMALPSWHVQHCELTFFKTLKNIYIYNRPVMRSHLWDWIFFFSFLCAPSAGISNSWDKPTITWSDLTMMATFNSILFFSLSVSLSLSPRSSSRRLFTSHIPLNYSLTLPGWEIVLRFWSVLLQSNGPSEILHSPWNSFLTRNPATSVKSWK